MKLFTWDEMLKIEEKNFRLREILLNGKDKKFNIFVFGTKTTEIQSKEKFLNILSIGEKKK